MNPLLDMQVKRVLDGKAEGEFVTEAVGYPRDDLWEVPLDFRESNPGLFGQVVNLPPLPSAAFEIKPTEDGLYYMAPGWVENVKVQGTGDWITLPPLWMVIWVRAVVRFDTATYVRPALPGGTAPPPIEYRTGAFQVLSADLVTSPSNVFLNSSFSIRETTYFRKISGVGQYGELVQGPGDVGTLRLTPNFDNIS